MCSTVGRAASDALSTAACAAPAADSTLLCAAVFALSVVAMVVVSLLDGLVASCRPGDTAHAHAGRVPHVMAVDRSEQAGSAGSAITAGASVRCVTQARRSAHAA
jgi:hypothetical protein